MNRLGETQPGTRARRASVADVASRVRRTGSGSCTGWSGSASVDRGENVTLPRGVARD